MGSAIKNRVAETGTSGTERKQKTVGTRIYGLNAIELLTTTDNISGWRSRLSSRFDDDSRCRSVV